MMGKQHQEHLRSWIMATITDSIVVVTVIEKREHEREKEKNKREKTRKNTNFYFLSLRLLWLEVLQISDGLL